MAHALRRAGEKPQSIKQSCSSAIDSERAVSKPLARDPRTEQSERQYGERIRAEPNAIRFELRCRIEGGFERIQHGPEQIARHRPFYRKEPLLQCNVLVLAPERQIFAPE